MATFENSSKVRSFRGLNNVTDQLRLGLAWLEQADNVDITDTGAIKKRAGYGKTMAGAFTGAYATIDHSRMYVVDGGALKAMAGPATAVTLRAGLAPLPMHFTEVNDRVYFNNGVDRGVIEPDHTVIDWAWPIPAAPFVSAVTGNMPGGLYRVCCTFTLADGRRETGASNHADIVLIDGQALQLSNLPQLAGLRTNVYIAPADSTVFQHAGSPSGSAMTWNASPDALGIDLLTDLLDPLPDGADLVQEWGGRIYAAQHFPAEDQSVVWYSQPLGFHLFNLAADFFIVPGQVLMLAPHEGALIVGTGTRIYAAVPGEKLEQLAPYGVVPGQHWAADGKRTLFWSTSGLCAALPFVNLTDRQVSVTPGLHAGGALVKKDGHKRYLIALQQGGPAFNPTP